MNLTHIRHGSHIIEFNNKRFLVDPVFADKGSMFALPKGRVNEKNPLNPLPFNLDFLHSVDVVLITHMHFDHFDDKAKELLPKDIEIFCAPVDVKKIKKSGFTNVTAIVKSAILYENIEIKITGGKHGVGLAGKLMGQTTGFVLKDISKNSSEPTTYIVGDSIWCDEISSVLTNEKPEVIITFAGSAKLPFGKPITMSTWDIHQLAEVSNKSKIIALHMDTWNHCYLTRDMLKEFITDKNYRDRIIIPKDGESLNMR